MTRRLTPAAVLALLAVFPLVSDSIGASSYVLVYLYFVFFWVTQATSWNVFSGYAGYLNFGQNAFFGTGVYTAALLIDRAHAPLLATIPVAAVTAALVSFLAGLLVFRLRNLAGEIFALFTLALGLGLGLVADNVNAIDGGRGIVLTDIAYPGWLGSINQMLYYVGLVIAVVAIAVAYAVQHSRMGLGLAAIRDDEHVGETLGVPAFRYKLIAFGLGSAISGASGALHAALISFVTPSAAFGAELPLLVILMSFIGGRRRWAGPVVGAVLIYTLSDRLTNLGLVEVDHMVVGALLVIVVLRLRAGIVDQLVRRPWVAVTGAVLGVVAMVASGHTGDGISVALAAMIGALVLLLVPEPAYGWLRARRPRRTVPQQAAPPDPPAPRPTVNHVQDGAQ